MEICCSAEVRTFRLPEKDLSIYGAKLQVGRDKGARNRAVSRTPNCAADKAELRPIGAFRNAWL